MNIISQNQDGLIKIIIEELDKKSQIEEFLNILEEDSFFEINFLNIQTLPKDIVIKLSKIKDKISIFTNESTLKSYLMNLGFELNFRDNYQNKNKTLNLEYIAMGGSAGSLKKFIELIKELPKSNISVFIVMHQKADSTSTLSTILQSYTKHYKVVEAKSDMKIEPSTIYTAPPGRHMIVAGGFIFLTDDNKRNFSKPSISTTFESLSNEYKNTLLAILVCGYGADGSDSLNLLQNNGTTVLIENPTECKATAMLENAIKTQKYDHVFNINEINDYISHCIHDDFFTNEDLRNFLEKIYKIYGYDYTGYSLSHIRRRVHLFYSALRPKNFKDFEQIVLTNKSIFKDLFLNISVNITTFFRNPQVFKL